MSKQDFIIAQKLILSYGVRITAQSPSYFNFS